MRGAAPAVPRAGGRPVPRRRRLPWTRARSPRRGAALGCCTTSLAEAGAWAWRRHLAVVAASESLQMAAASVASEFAQAERAAPPPYLHPPPPQGERLLDVAVLRWWP
uniref:Uncharacterized protein n=1 Tax=Arundo donax TaxID=35708 RepID=A0A0A8Y5N4_ARUDO